MSTTFKRVAIQPTTDWNQVYTCPAGVTAIIFSSHVSNIDDLNKAEHFITVKQNISGVDYLRLNFVPVPYGSALQAGKMVLQAGDAVYVKSDANTSLNICIDFMERT